MQILIVFLINLLAFSPFVKSQTVQNQPTGDLPNPYLLIKDNLKRNNRITPLFELKAMENKYLASPMWKEPYLDVMIYLEGYVGNYGAAYDYEKFFYETKFRYFAAETVVSPFALFGNFRIWRTPR